MKIKMAITQPIFNILQNCLKNPKVDIKSFLLVPSVLKKIVREKSFFFMVGNSSRRLASNPDPRPRLTLPGKVFRETESKTGS